MRDFEVAKRNFQPATSFTTRIPKSLDECSNQNNGETIEEIVHSTSFPYKGAIKVIGDRLMIESAVLKTLFSFVTEQIVCHISDILSDPKVADCSLMLLVGGFSESPIVQKIMRGRFQTEERRVIIPKRSRSVGRQRGGHSWACIGYCYKSCCSIQLWYKRH